MEESLLPGSRGKISRLYEVDKGHHSESYIVAIRGNVVPVQSIYSKPDIVPILPDDLEKNDTQPPSTSPLLRDEYEPTKKKPDEQFGYTIGELERYRNDPFWKTLRWILFIIFWLLWILMFLAAILIVMFSPRCAPQVVPNWWQNAIAYQVWTPSFQDSDGSGIGDFVGLINRLENLRRLGIQVLWLNPFLLSDGFTDAIRDHLAVDSKLGNNDDAYKLVDAIHDKGMKIVISLPVGVTSKEHDWYYRSARATLKENANFSDYYHWREAANDTPFMSKYKNVSYIHHENRPNWPVLNWQSASVRQNMFDVMSYWIDKGIDGFYLSGIEYLARLKHGSVADWSRILDILRDIRDHVDNYAKRSPVAEKKQIVLFATRDNAGEKEKKELVSNGLDSVINYELGSVGKDNQICHRVEGNVGGCVHEILADMMQFHAANNISAMWEFGNPQLSRVASRVKSQKQAELLTMVQLLLPGTNSIYYGDEIGMIDLPTNTTVPVQRGAMQWDDSANAGFSSATKPNIPVHPNFADNTWAKQYSLSRSHLKTFQKMARLRKQDQMLGNGRTTIGQMSNSAFTVIRYSDDQNSTARNTYLGAFNFGNSDATLSIQETSAMENKKLDQAMVIVSSSNAEQYYPRQTVDLSSGIVTLASEQGVVFKFTS